MLSMTVYDLSWSQVSLPAHEDIHVLVLLPYGWGLALALVRPDWLQVVLSSGYARGDLTRSLSVEPVYGQQATTLRGLKRAGGPLPSSDSQRVLATPV